MSIETPAPRVFRHKDVPKYLGMCEDTFNELVRPEVTVIKIGIRGIGYDRYELDDWLDDYIKNEHNIVGNKRPGNSKSKRSLSWAKTNIPTSSKEAIPGTLTSDSMEKEFAKALESVTNGKQ